MELHSCSLYCKVDTKSLFKVLGFLSLKTSFAQCRMENTASLFNIDFRALPLSVRKYPILTGISVECTFLLINPLFSISFNLAESIFGFIPSMESRNWLNLVLSRIISRIIKIVNFLPTNLNVVSIGQHFISSLSHS
jgi:hypothetical protein